MFTFKVTFNLYERFSSIVSIIPFRIIFIDLSSQNRLFRRYIRKKLLLTFLLYTKDNSYNNTYYVFDILLIFAIANTDREGAINGQQTL